MDTKILDIANRALSEALERLASAKQECAYWSSVISEAVSIEESAPQPASPSSRRGGKVSERRDKEMQALNAAAHRIFNKVIPNHPGVTGSQVMAGNRKKEVVAARAECIAGLRKACPGVSLVSLGQFFGMDHSSIIYHLRANAGEQMQ